MLFGWFYIKVFLKYNKVHKLFKIGFFEIDKKCAFIIIKKGFISSAGCNAIKPRLNHLREPLIEPPKNGTATKSNKQTKKPRYDKFNIEILENIDTKIMIDKHNKA